MELKELREHLGMTQEQVANKMHLPITTIRKWEKKEAIPALPYMNLIADIFDVEVKEVIAFFDPENTKASQDDEYENKMAEYLEQFFLASSDIDAFFLFCTLIANGHRRGAVYNDIGIFPFSIARTGDARESTALILMDYNMNRVILTRRNILRVKPYTAIFDVFTFEITANCPILPVDIDYNPTSFQQTFRVSFFDADNRKR